MAFGGKIRCPVDAATRQWIDQRWAWLMKEFGRDGFRKRPLILPDQKFFPDPYAGTPEDVEALLFRVACYMEIDPETIELKFYRDVRIMSQVRHEGPVGGYRAENGKFQILLAVSHLENPGPLIATMAHEFGHVHLLGHGCLSSDAADYEPLTDLITVFFGMGVITANAVILERYWNTEDLGRWSIGRHGYLTMPMYGYALALYARDREEENPQWVRELRLDVRSAYTQAVRYLEQGEWLRPEKMPTIPPGVVFSAKKQSAEDEQVDGDKVRCTYCDAEIESIGTEDVEDGSRMENNICAACRDSIAESEAELTAVTASELARYTRQGLYGVLITVLGIVGIAILMMIFGKAF
jgi:hypothetical protein